MNAHDILACIELAIYCTLLLPITFCTVHYIFKRQTAWLYLHAFVIDLIPNCPGTPPLRNISFANTSSKTDSGEYGPSYSPLTTLSQSTSKISTYLRLIHPIIACGLVLGIVGGVDRMPDSSTGEIDADKYDRGATFSKVSADLFIIAICAISVGALRLWKKRKSFAAVSYYIISGMAVILPLLFLRVLYSVLNAANLDTTKHRGYTAKFNVMTGSWVVYFFLGLIPQAMIVWMYVASGVVAWFKD